MLRTVLDIISIITFIGGAIGFTRFFLLDRKYGKMYIDNHTDTMSSRQEPFMDGYNNSRFIINISIIKSDIFEVEFVSEYYKKYNKSIIKNGGTITIDQVFPKSIIESIKVRYCDEFNNLYEQTINIYPFFYDKANDEHIPSHSTISNRILIKSSFVTQMKSILQQINECYKKRTNS